MLQPAVRTFRISIFILLAVLLHSLAVAQGTVQFSLAVINHRNQPLAGLTVVAMETTTLKSQTSKTDGQGRTTMQLGEGKEWIISIGLIKQAMHIVCIPQRRTTVNKMYVYDLKEYERKKLQDDNRVNDKFKIISRVVAEKPDIKPGECFLGLALQHPQGGFLPGITVELVNVKDSIIYRSKTDDRGRAFFIVPNKNNYDIDVAGVKNYGFIDFGNEYKASRLVLEYAPTVVKERVIDNMIHQEVNETSRPSSARALIRLAVFGGKKDGKRERVYMRQLPSGKVYTALTNDQGYVYFLLPNKYVYIVDFEFQKDADAINLMYSADLTSGAMTVHYAPDPKLESPETFIPSTQNLLVKNFNDFLQKQFARPKDKPFSLELKGVRRIHPKSQEALFMLTLSGSEPKGKVRLPMNAAFVLDKSGSMYSDDRINALKHALVTIGNSLLPTDVISVILFDDAAYEVNLGDQNNQVAMKTVSDYYSPSGGTNIFAGLKAGEESLKRSFDQKKANKIFLLTDGYDSTPPQEITAFVEEKFKEGIEFSTIGLGADFNQSLLELIAMKGNGSFNFVDSSAMLTDAFLKEVSGALSYSAKDLRIEIFHHDKLIFSNLYGYPVTNKTKQSVSFEIGKVPYGVNRIAFLKFKLNNPLPDIQASPLRMKVSYFDLEKQQDVTYQQEVKLEWTNETETELMFDQEEKKLYAIAILNQSMKLMAEAHEQGNDQVAKAALADGVRQIEEIFPDARPKDVEALFDEVKRYIGLFGQMEKNSK